MVSGPVVRDVAGSGRRQACPASPGIVLIGVFRNRWQPSLITDVCYFSLALLESPRTALCVFRQLASSKESDIRLRDASRSTGVNAVALLAL